MTQANNFSRSRDMDCRSRKTTKKNQDYQNFEVTVAHVNIFRSCSNFGNLKI